jgi:hypothetical protein
MTTFTHDTETGWGFTIGNQPYIGYATREQAQEAAYDIERGSAYVKPEPAGDTDALTHIFQLLEDETVIAEWIDANAPRVTAERQICHDSIALNNGQEEGTNYRCGDESFIYVPDEKLTPYCAPQLFIFGREGMDIAEFLAELPNIMALLNDPRVKAACADWDARYPA